METKECKCGFRLVLDNERTEFKCPRCRKVYRTPEKVQETCENCGKEYEDIKFPVDLGFAKRCPKCEEKDQMDAEMAYELRSNFEPGTTVVNVMTGERWVV